MENIKRVEALQIALESRYIDFLALTQAYPIFDDLTRSNYFWKLKYCHDFYNEVECDEDYGNDDDWRSRYETTFLNQG